MNIFVKHIAVTEGKATRVVLCRGGDMASKRITATTQEGQSHERLSEVVSVVGSAKKCKLILQRFATLPDSLHQPTLQRTSVPLHVAS